MTPANDGHFSTYEHNGKIYLALGLYQIWFNPRLTLEPRTRWRDPPILAPAVITFMQAHRPGWAYGEDISGVPTFVFDNRETYEDFFARFEIGQWGPGHRCVGPDGKIMRFEGDNPTGMRWVEERP